VIIEVESADEKHDIGVMVDSVSEVLEIPRSEIEPPPAFGAKIRVDFMAGMGKVAGKFVIILNANKVLSVDELSMLGEAADSVPIEQTEADVPDTLGKQLNSKQG
jgi:purine-binding chemotaxis protein CheW